MPERRLNRSRGGLAGGALGVVGRQFACSALFALAACTAKKPTEQTYFDRTIKPILQDSCVSTNTGANCHVADAKGNAFGNLSLQSYADIAKRRDLLVNYGPYATPNMLLKNVDSFGVRLHAHDGTDIPITTDIRHAGGKTLGLTSAGFNTLKRWIADGASESNAPTAPVQPIRDDCSESYPADPAFNPDQDPAAADFPEFKVNVQSVLGDTCAASNCHGAEGNILRLVCAESRAGNSDVLARWNYFEATKYLATKKESLSASEILRRPLDPAAGGGYHEGGAIFETQNDEGFVAMSSWITAHGPNTNVPKSPGFEFFAKRVQPMLVKKGCMVLGCHSPAMFHDYRLRGGTNATFSLPTTLTNYELTLQQIAMESPDPSASRLIAKNLLRSDEQVGGRGIQHRGGSLFDDFPAAIPSPALCGDGKAAETGDLDQQHAYCVIARWIQIEQQAAKLKPLSGVVYVKKRPAPGADTPQDYAAYAPSLDLCFTALAIDPMSFAVSSPTSGACTSLLATCGGLAPATADIRHPSVSWKGDKVAFAARNSAAEPFAVWTVNVDGTGCAKQADIAAPPNVPGWSDNGATIHNFDPVFAPDDRIVFASTRGNVMNTGAFDYQGPQRTPADPAKWNANLYVLDGPGKIRQLTFLLNQEILPSMMSDGRLIYTVEKRAPGFYQLAGRRQNLDGGDYHPLFGQRRTIGFDQVTDIVELSNKNLAGIFSNRGAAHGGGALGIVNRSLGPDQHSPNAADYVADPAAIDWPEPKFFLHGLCFPGTPECKLPAGTAGAYRSPAPLPNGNLIVSFAANVMDVTSFSGNFDLYVVDEATGARTQITSDPAADEIFPVGVYERFNRGVFKSRPDEANANTRVYAEGEDPNHPADRSEVTILDVPMLESLLFQNTRTGRPFSGFSSLEVYEDLPPDLGETSLASGSPFVAMDAYGPVYARRRSLGVVAPYDDGSARVALPGGVPIVLAGPFALDGGEPSHHFQREEMQFYPGEYAHQSFPRIFFDGFCGGCHGSVSGYENDLTVQPDILTQASRVQARDSSPVELAGPATERGPVVGPGE